VILGVVLGPVMEIQFRRALIASGGDWGVFVERPLTVVLLGVALLAIALPYLPRLLARIRRREPSMPARLALGDGD
jgi:putative tricarboxylic transport membrane protein